MVSLTLSRYVNILCTIIRLDATTHRHWPVSAMVRAGLSKCETVSSNPSAVNDVVVEHNIRHLIIVC